MLINKRMFNAMDQKGIKDAELAKEIGKNKSVISTWRARGTNPPIEYAVQICNYIGISLSYLITGKDGEDLTQEEQMIVEAYRLAAPAIQTATKKLLDVPDQQGKSLISGTGKEAI